MRRAELKERTRNEILKAALEVFAQMGYRGASLDEIAKKARLTKGALYWHYKDKRDLYNAVNDFALGEYERQVLKPLSDITNPKQKLEQMTVMTLKFYQENPTINDFYFATLLEGHLTLQSKIVRRITQTYRDHRAMIAQVISEGSRLNRFIDIDPKAAASILLAVSDGVLIQWALDENEVDLNQVGRNATRILFEGLDRKDRL